MHMCIYIILYNASIYIYCNVYIVYVHIYIHCMCIYIYILYIYSVCIYIYRVCIYNIHIHRTSTHRVKLNQLSTAGHLVQTLWPGMDTYIVNTNFGEWMNIHKSQLTFNVHQLCHDDHEIFPHYPHLPTIYLAKLQSGWWFQPLWKILVRLDHHPNYWGKYGKIKNVPNHQPESFSSLEISEVQQFRDNSMNPNLHGFQWRKTSREVVFFIHPDLSLGTSRSSRPGAFLDVMGVPPIILVGFSMGFSRAPNQLLGIPRCP